MKTPTWIARLALCAFLFTALAPDAVAQPTPATKGDAAAMKKLAQAHLAEIESGKLASGKAQSEEVRQFAQRMVDDHGKMLQDLQKLASAKGVSLPDTPSAKDRAEMKIVERFPGAQFDRRYMADMVEDHKETWKQADGMASVTRDPEFKALADDTKGVIKQHLDLAQQIARSLSASSRSSKSAPAK